VAAALLFLTFVLIPGVSRIKSQARAVAAAEADLAEVRKARPEIERIQKEPARERDRPDRRQREGRPLSRITSALRKRGFRRRR